MSIIVKLQTMTKTPVKFEKDRHKTVGVVHTRYLLLEGGWNHVTMEQRKAEYYVPSLFFKKGVGQLK